MSRPLTRRTVAQLLRPIHFQALLPATIDGCTTIQGLYQHMLAREPTLQAHPTEFGPVVDRFETLEFVHALTDTEWITLTAANVGNQAWADWLTEYRRQLTRPPSPLRRSGAYSPSAPHMYPPGE